MVIGINCGHTVSGQPGSGAVGYLNESNETREVGRPLMELLRKAGHKVVDCTNDYAKSTSENLSEIVRLANAQTLDLFVSIHLNCGGGKGCEVYTYGGKTFAAAENVCRNLSGFGFVNRGVKDGSRLYVVHRTNAKAMLIEVCFVDSKTDSDLYKRIGAEHIAEAISRAITGGDEQVSVQSSADTGMSEYEELKREVQSMKPVIYDYIDDNMPAWARPTVKKLRDKGLLSGDENGRLGLTDAMMRTFVVMDNAGVFG